MAEQEGSLFTAHDSVATRRKASCKYFRHHIFRKPSHWRYQGFMSLDEVVQTLPFPCEFFEQGPYALDFVGDFSHLPSWTNQELADELGINLGRDDIGMKNVIERRIHGL
jgi:hypothetical protein